jgi:hypothetical protein
MSPPDIVKGRPPVTSREGGPDARSANITATSITALRPFVRDAVPYLVTDLPIHLARNVAVDPETGEWIWTGPIDRDGYGRYNGKGVHRVVYGLLIGPIPPRYQIDHVRARG